MCVSFGIVKDFFENSIDEIGMCCYKIIKLDYPVLKSIVQ